MGWLGGGGGGGRCSGDKEWECYYDVGTGDLWCEDHDEYCPFTTTDGTLVDTVWHPQTGNGDGGW